eukprot:jgi/Psemu1/23666/gm1.23666_g
MGGTFPTPRALAVLPANQAGTQATSKQPPRHPQGCIGRLWPSEEPQTEGSDAQRLTTLSSSPKQANNNKEDFDDHSTPLHSTPPPPTQQLGHQKTTSQSTSQPMTPPSCYAPTAGATHCWPT